MKKILILFLISTSLFGAGVLEFPNADVYYPDGYRDVAVYVGKVFETVRSDVIRTIENDPGRINLILQDIGTVSNGMTNSMFHKSIYLYVWPPDYSNTTELSSWYRMLITHEFAHMVHLTYNRGIPALLNRFIFHSDMPTAQMGTPFLESVTLYAESAQSEFQGRLNNPLSSNGLYDSSFAGGYFPDMLYALSSNPNDFRGGTLYYNYPAGLYKYIVEEYGLDSMKEVFEKTASRYLFSGPEKSFKEVFEKTPEEMYEEWVENGPSKRTDLYDDLYEHEIGENRRIISIAPSENGNYVSTIAYGPVSGLKGIRKVRTVLMDYSGNILSEFGFPSMAMKEDRGDLYFVKRVLEQGKYKNELWRIKENGGTVMLMKGRITAFDIIKGDVYTAIYDTREMSTSILKDGEKLTEIPLHVRDIAISDTGEIALMVSEESKNPYIAKLNGDKLEFLLTDNYFKGTGITWWGKKIVYTASYNDPYMNAYALDSETGEVFELTRRAVLFNAYVNNDSLYGYGYSRKGQGMSFIETDPELIPFEIPKTDEVDFKLKDVYYSDGDLAGKNLSFFIDPVMMVPSLTSDGTGLAIGYSFLNSDVESKLQLMTTPYFDVIKESYGVTLNVTGKPAEGSSFAGNMIIDSKDGSEFDFSINYNLLRHSATPETTLKIDEIFTADSLEGMNIGTKISLFWKELYFSAFPYVSIEDFDKPQPGITATIGYTPNMKTYLDLKLSYDGEFNWKGRAIRNLYEVNEGWRRLYFLSNIAAEFTIGGNLLPDNGSLALVFQVLPTPMYGVSFYPKIGMSLENGKPSLIFTVDTGL